MHGDQILMRPPRSGPRVFLVARGVHVADRLLPDGIPSMRPKIIRPALV